MHTFEAAPISSVELSPKSIPSPSLVDETVCAILRSERAIVGDWIRLNAIRRRWLVSGFRVSDLISSLARLSVRGFFYLTGPNDDAFLVVTELPNALRIAHLRAVPKMKRAQARCSANNSTFEMGAGRRLTDRS